MASVWVCAARVFKELGYVLSVSASTRPWQYRPTLHWSRVKLQSLCSSAVGARARRRCAPPPSSRAALERCAAGPSGAPTPVSNRRCAEPTPPACQHRLQQPKGALGGGSGPVVAAAHQLGPVSALNIGKVHRHCQQQALGVLHDMSLAALHFLAGVVTSRSPFSVVFTAGPGVGTWSAA